MRTLLTVIVVALAFSTAHAADVSCTLHTVTGPNRGLNPDGSIRRNTQTAEIKMEAGPYGAVGGVTIDDIYGTVIMRDDSAFSFDIIKYETSIGAHIPNVKIPGETLKQDQTLLLLELPDNDRAWISCSKK